MGCLFNPKKDASHGHWYYNGDEFGGIFKVKFYTYFSIILKNICKIVVELEIGKGETSNDPQEKYRIDEVSQAFSSTLIATNIFIAIPTECG